jgi:hypothetical protein
MKWQPIETAPKDGPVLLYFANRKFHHPDGTPASMGEVRGYVERTEVGFCENGEICESGTGHDVFEEWRGPENLPTHWMPLPEPPGRVAMSSEIPYTSIGDGPMTDHTAPERLYTRAEVDALVVAAYETAQDACTRAAYDGQYPQDDNIELGCLRSRDYIRALTTDDARASLRAHTEAAVRRALVAAAKAAGDAAVDALVRQTPAASHLLIQVTRMNVASQVLALDHAQFIGDEE